jgi:solute carrier family 25 carnitine/acylcarnitine transporter 20/29
MSLSETYVDFIAGWASGAIAVGVCQPVDTVLTRLQAGRRSLSSSSSLGVVGSTVTSDSVFVQTRGMVANFGMASLWRGSSAMISAVPMQNCLLMGGYGVGKKWSSLNNSNNLDSDGANNKDDTQQQQQQQQTIITYISVFVGGCSGGIVQSFLMSPVELIKVNQQVIGKTAKAAGMEVLQGLTSSRKSWRGLNATLLRDGIPHGVWFLSYEWCKTALEQTRMKGTTGEQVTVPLISGAFAATVAWVSRILVLLFVFCFVCLVSLLLPEE